MQIGTVTVNDFIPALPVFGNRAHISIFYSAKCRTL